MTAALWKRIDAYDFDADAAPGYLAAKLAEENGWTVGRADRAIGEYRRYVYLSCVTDHVVVPSDDVDCVWHQHLLDTERYWGYFCPVVLGRDLHHRPNKGGGLGVYRHRELYRRTLASYAALFGENPPDDVWPPPEQRFGREADHRRIALAHNWVVPKRGRTTVTLAVSLVVAVLIVEWWLRAVMQSIATCGLNISYWSGSAFAGVFAVAGGFALFATCRLFPAPHRRVGANPTTAAAPVELDFVDAAVLSCDTRRAVNAAIASLVCAGAVGFHSGGEEVSQPCDYTLVPTGVLRADALPLERAVYESVSMTGTSVSLIHRATSPTAKDALESLRRRGLLGSRWNVGPTLVAQSPLLLLTLACINAWWWGQSAALLAAVISANVTAVFWVVALLSAPVTSLGGAALAAARARVEELSGDRGVAWIVALEGAQAVDRLRMPVLREALTADAAHGGGGDGVTTAGCGGKRDPNSTHGCA